MKKIGGRLVLDTLPEIAAPRHTALLVVDIQNDNCSPRGMAAVNGRDIARAREIIPNVKKVLEEARRLGLLIVFMRMTESRNGILESDPVLRRVEKTTESGDLADYLMEGTWGNEVLDELEPRPNERQMIKYRSSSFIGTPLDLLLKTNGIKAAVVVGVVTEGCVETTVRDLDQFGYYPVVLSDCVASRREDIHEAALLVMAHRYDVVKSAELLKIWRSASMAKS